MYKFCDYITIVSINKDYKCIKYKFWTRAILFVVVLC